MKAAGPLDDNNKDRMLKEDKSKSEFFSSVFTMENMGYADLLALKISGWVSEEQNQMEVMIGTQLTEN